ncbi:hypothetical protein LZC95_14255 [Pendulispora brunnea]|uniref:Uncharacterized protein n=1 Tax=Pendulispora brunnea TaxID=2905690 RepID=A0ABZ2KK77_9BACT
MTDSAENVDFWYANARASRRLLPHESASLTPGLPAPAVRELVTRVEEMVAASPERAFSFDADGTATLSAPGRGYAAGRFAIPTIAELRARLESRPRGVQGKLRLSALVGTHPLTDIGTLQASAPEGVLFQAASQFNCLEAPGPRIVPVRHYLSDPTQGPRASISAFPGTLLRHYRAPSKDGSLFVQTDDRGINLLEDVFDNTVAEIWSGYLQVANVHQPSEFAASLEAHFERIRVGVHDGVEVVYGGSWGGPVPRAPEHRIAQVFTSTVALGGYGPDRGWAEIAVARRQLLRAAYLGTILAALDLGKHTIVLTLIGGGVFANPLRDIWSAIHWALSEADQYADGVVDIIVNTRGKLEAQDRDAIRQREGAVLSLGSDGVSVT